MDNEEKKVDESWKEDVEKQKTNNPVTDDKAHEGHNHGEIPEVNFSMFVSSLAMQALMQMGYMPNPLTKKSEKDLPNAQYIIEILDLLKKKTENNLTKEEAELIENAVYDLKMRFVEANK